MADYLASTRSNYVKVNSVKKFREFCQRYNLTVVNNAEPGRKRRYGFLVDGPIPTGYTDARGEWIETEDILGELARLLVKGEVAVLMEIGSEKMRYLIGYACAVDWRGRKVSVSLNEIYAKARNVFGVEPSLAEY